MRISTLCFLSSTFLVACTSTTDDTGIQSNNAASDTGTAVDNVEDSVCQEDYSVCGQLLIPNDLTGTPRSLVVALYDSVPPAGPPAGIVTEIESPAINSGETYSIEEQPVLFTGEYFIWVNLYMEGGGEWAPVNDVDFTAYTPSTVIFDGSPIRFDDMTMELATGW